MSTPNAIASLESLDTNALLARRQELVNRAKLVPGGTMQASRLNDEELTELVGIFSILRRRSSPGAPKKEPAKQMNLGDVPADI